MNRVGDTLKDLAFACGLVLAFSLLVRPVFEVPFAVGDDHRIIAMNYPGRMEPAYIKALYGNRPDLQGSIKNDAQIGRLRLAGWTFTKLQCLLWGDHARAWRLANVGVMLLSLLFFAAICRRLRLGTLATWTLLCLYAFGQNNETWWTLIPPAQNMGELLLLAGFYCWIRFRAEQKTAFRNAALLLFLLPALVKESFIFCIPFVWLADFFFFSREKKLFSAESFLLLLVFLLPLAGLIFVILLSGTVYSYPYPDSVFDILAYNAWRFFYSSVFLLAPLALFLLRRFVITRCNLLKFSLLTFSWLAVQLVLLKGIKMNDQHHYLMPGLLLVLFLSAFSIHFIQYRSKKLHYALAALYFVFALWQAKNTFINARFYAAQVKSFYAMISKIKSEPRRHVVYLTTQPLAGDWLMGTSAILRWKNISSQLHFASYSCGKPQWILEFEKTRPPLAFPPAPEDLSNAWIMSADHFEKGLSAGEAAKQLEKNGEALTAIYLEDETGKEDCYFSVPVNGNEFFFCQEYLSWELKNITEIKRYYCGYGAVRSAPEK